MCTLLSTKSHEGRKKGEKKFGTIPGRGSRAANRVKVNGGKERVKGGAHVGWYLLN